MKTHDKEIEDKETQDKKIEEKRKELLKLWGLGPETVDAILLYAGGKPTFVVDAYTRRIFSRVGIFDESIGYEAMRDFFMECLPRDTALYNEFHAQIDALGNRLCLSKNPRCHVCPLAELCNSRQGLFVKRQDLRNHLRKDK